MKRVSWLFASVNLILAGCGPSGLFIPTIEATEPVVETIPSGTVLEPGTEFEVRTDSVDTGATEVVLQITDENGDLQAELTYPVTGLVSEESVVLPELPAGRYDLVIQLLAGPDLINQQTRTFFVGDTGNAPQLLSLFPVNPASGAELIVRSSSPFHQETDEVPIAAWYQWYLDGELVYAASVLQDWILTAPASPGVYSLELDRFPVPPRLEEVWPFRSSVSTASDLPVSDPEELEEEVSDPGRYLVRHEFRGELRDHGAWEDLFGAAPILARDEAAVLSLSAGTLGYTISPDGGISRDIYPLPADYHRLLPFTLEFSIVLMEPGSILTVDSTEAPDLRLSVSDFGQLLMDFGSAGRLSGPVVELGVPLNLAVSYRPSEDGDTATVEWFVGGELAGSHSVTSLVRTSDQSEQGAIWQAVPGRYQLGGDPQSAEALVDAMRVFFRSSNTPSANPDLFREAMFRYYRDALVWASGFEDESILTELDISGPVRVRRGMLEVGRGGEALFPEWDFGNEDLVIELDTGTIPVDSFISLVIRDDTGRNLTLFGDGTLAGAEPAGATQTSFAQGTLRIRVSHRDGGLTFTFHGVQDGEPAQPRAETPISVSLDTDQEFGGVALLLAGSGAELQQTEADVLQIDSVTAVRRDDGLANRLLGSNPGD